jgi:protein-tyrosine kinase
MGRVYNALVRAGRWGDRVRPQFVTRRPPHQDRATTTPPQFDLREITQSPKPLHQNMAATVALDDAAASGTSRPHPTSRPDRVHESQRVEPSIAPPQPAPPASTLELRQAINISPSAVDPHMVTISDCDEFARERYHTLAVRLLNISAKRGIKTLLITSARQAEGKSTVAANLAWVMAKANERRVLLIDADLRQPSINRMLGIKARVGLSELIEGRATLADALVQINPNGLCVLAASSFSPNPDAGYKSAADAITSSRVEELIKQSEQHFDFILIDAPPILEFAEAQRLASLTDGTILVVRAERTHHSAVTDALKLVPKEHRLGVVLNQSSVDSQFAYQNYYRKNKRESRWRFWR